MHQANRRKHLFSNTFIMLILCLAFTSLLGVNHALAQTDKEILNASKIFQFDENYPIFTDTSPADAFSTKHGNPGNTMGEQRLLAFKYALGIIASELRINQPIDIIFNDDKVKGCYYFAIASYQYSYYNGDNQIPDTLYPSALSNQLSHEDTSENDADIWVRFNKKIMNNECNVRFTYGFKRGVGDANTADFVDLILHEITHGLGFEIRPSSDAMPFIFERMLWVKDQQANFAELNKGKRLMAKKKDANIVFNGRTIHKYATRLLDTQVTLVAQTNKPIKLPKIDDNVVNTEAIPDSGLSGPISILDFNSCAIDGNLKGKIVLLPGGCAREELGYNGKLFNGIMKAQQQGALAIITNMEENERRTAYTDISIPVLTITLTDYKKFQAALKRIPADTQFELQKQQNQLMGTDKYGRPYMFTGRKINPASMLVHFKPAVSPKPVDNKTVRNLMEPDVSWNGLEFANRSLGVALPALVDLGWAVHSCGNGKVEKFEECDSGNINGTASCAQNCTLPGYCGDGVVNSATEQCDNGADNNDNKAKACSSMCRINP